MNALVSNIGHATPEAARQIFDALCELRDRCAAVRIQLVIERAPVAERMAAGFIQGDIEQAIKTTHRYLSKVARAGGRGVPPLGAGQRPASAQVGASIGHGGPAFAPAIGIRVHKAAGATEVTPEDPLSFARQGNSCQR